MCVSSNRRRFDGGTEQVATRHDPDEPKTPGDEDTFDPMTLHQFHNVLSGPALAELALRIAARNLGPPSSGDVHHGSGPWPVY